jgi:hypothetical protein
MSRDPVPYEPQGTPDMSSPPSRGHSSKRAERSGARASEAHDPAVDPSSRNLSPRNPWPSEREETPRTYTLRDRTFLLRSSELHTLGELGKFRVIAAPDLTRHAYAGDTARMERDLRRLRRQALVSERTLEISGKKTLRAVTLTKTGRRLLKQTGHLPEEQAIYHGLVKPREAKHDADLYRLYHKEAARIERDGGKPLRVVLDFELKRNLNRGRVALGPDKNNPGELDRLAKAAGLSVVDGKIPVPDLRIEYQTVEGEVRRVDLELATRHYRPAGLAAKAKAGFSLYSFREDASRLRRILDDRELTAGILAL